MPKRKTKKSQKQSLLRRKKSQSLQNRNKKIEVKKISTTVLTPLNYLGKPFYLIIVYFVIGFLFFVYLIGHTVRVYIPHLFGYLTFLLVNSFKNTVWKLKSAFFSKNKKISLRSFLAKFKVLKVPSLKFKLGIPKIKKPEVKISFLTPGKIKAVLFVLTVFGIGVFAFWYTILRTLPSPHDLTSRKIQVSTKILDRNGVLLYKIYKDQNRTPVALTQISPQVRAATLAAEDAEFYSHPGISIKGIIRSLWVNITKGQLVGGSTITQQLVKNALLTPEKTITRKIKEVVLSIATELTYSKDQILEMYLNQVPYGGTAFGIEEAAKLYFDKDVDKLTLGEAALLAGLPRSPTNYSPFGSNPELATVRQKEVLRLMNENGFITRDEMNHALSEKTTFAPNRIDIKAPHFVMYVRQQLADKYGEDAVATGGLTVTTTLDYGIQKMAEEVVKKQVETLTNFHVGNGAVVVLNPKTGEILAMVGSKDYFDIKNDGNVNVTIAPRQPGSSIKVVTYAYALSHGFTPATIIGDTPTKFSIPGQPPYIPRDYDGDFRGNISVRSALAESRNIPAVKILATFGVEKLIELGRKMGITTWKDPSYYGLSLTLGGGETKLLDLAQVYATIANQGVRPNVSSILKVTDYQGETLEEQTCNKEGGKKGTVYAAEANGDSLTCDTEQAIDPRVAYLLIDILKDNNARAPSFGSRSALVIPNHPEVAVKTGTSNDLKDNLTVGFNQDYLTAVWVGNNDGTSMGRIASGITGAAPIWNEIMSRLLATSASTAWKQPSGVLTVSVCSLTGTLACEGCPTRSELFLDETKPQYACKPDQVTKMMGDKTKKNSTGQILDNAASTQN